MSPPRTQSFGERTLGIQFHLEFSGQNKLFEELALADVARDHFSNLAILEEQADTEVSYAGVVADDGKVFGTPAASQRFNEIFRIPHSRKPHLSTVRRRGDLLERCRKNRWLSP